MRQKRSKIRLKDIAAELGCSITTVSRVLSGRSEQYRISKGTQEKVIAAAKEKKFRFNNLARALRIQETYTIGLIVPDIANPFFSGVAQNIEVEARKLGYSIILCDSNEDETLEAESIEVLSSRQVSGLIISPVGQTSDHLQRLYDTNIPTVLIDRYFPNLSIPYVGTDNHKGAFQAVEYLLECGHRLIACLQGAINTFINKERLRGYKDALQKNGIAIEPLLVKGDGFGIESGYLSTKLLLNQSPIPTAILGFSNLITLGSLMALREENLKVPEDISIITFDEQSYSGYLSLTTIKQRNEEMGQIAVKLLMGQFADKKNKPQGQILLPPSLIVRNSVRILHNASEKSRASK